MTTVTQIIILLGGILIGGLIANTIWYHSFCKYLRHVRELQKYTDIENRKEIVELKEEISIWRNRAELALHVNANYQNLDN